MNNTLFKLNLDDWIIEDWQKILKPKYTYKELKKAYRQSEVHRNSCSIHWAMTMISNNFNIDFSLKERQWLWERAIDNGASESWGWRFSDAIKLIKDYCKEENKLDFKYFSVKTAEMQKYLDDWFCIYWWIKIKEWFNADKLKDWFIWDADWYWNDKYWHWICFTKFEDWNIWYIDNYSLHTKYNEVRFRDFQKLCDLWVFFPIWYIATTTEEIVKNWYNHLTLREKEEKLRNRPEAIKKQQELNN